MEKYNVARLQKFFLEKAAETYASSEKAVRTPGRPWERTFERRSGELTYIDHYVVNGEWSGGSTLILVSDVPAWLMQYHGWCKDDDKEVLDFHKRALSYAYSGMEFRGGRGPSHYEEIRDKGLVYENWSLTPPSRPQNFTGFLHYERIWRKLLQSEDLFWHRCQGLLLGEAEK